MSCLTPVNGDSRKNKNNVLGKNMLVHQTALPFFQRIKLFCQPKLGCGNFLHFAVNNNPYRDKPLFFLEKPFQTFMGQTINNFSLSSLKDVVDQYTLWYYQSEIRENDPVAIYLEDGIGYLIHYLALNNLGAIPVLVNGCMAYDIAADYISRVGCVAVYTDSQHIEELKTNLTEEKLLKFLTTDRNNSFTDGTNKQLPLSYPYSPADSHPIMICHSSGTTGKPKPVIFAHKQFFFGKRIRLLNFSSQSDKFLFALPSSHSAGISYFMTATLLGLPTMVLSDLSGKNAIRHIQDFQPTLVAAFPQTYAEMASEPLKQDALNSVRKWFNTGDSAHEAHIKALVNAGNRCSVFVDGLGASELGMALFNKISNRQTTLYSRYMGKPRSFVEAVVLDEEGNFLPSYQVGFLGIKSPTITPGYWNDSQRTFKSYKKGYWTTGDLVYYDNNNKFYHVDRSVDSIKSTNGLVNSLPIEELILKNNSDVADCTVIGIPTEQGFDGLVALVKLKRERERKIAASKLIADINKQLSDNKCEQLSFLSLVEKFPVGSTGKILKRQLRDEYKNIWTLGKQSLSEKSIYDFAYSSQRFMTTTASS